MAIRSLGMVSGMDTESIVKQLVDAQKLKNKKTSDKSTLLEWKKEKWQALNTKLYKLYTDSVSKMRLQGSYGTKQVATSNDSIVSITGNATAPTGQHTLSDIKLASAQYVTGSKITATATTTLESLYGGTIAAGTKITMGAKSLDITATTTVNDVVNLAKDAGLNASFDANQGRFFISSKASGVSNAFTFSSTDSVLLDKIGLGTGATTIAAADSSVKYNGVTVTDSDNTISVNGLTLTLKGATAVGETVSVNVSNDTKATYDMIKSFVKSYNDIVKEMNTLYDAPAAKGYAPLSDDEKEKMSDDQVTKWETKIKDSILRRDSTIGELKDSMRSALGGLIDVGGKSYSLASYGIQTSKVYSENGLLHIAGDSEDALYGSSPDKLMKALQEDPDTTTAAISGIMTNLYNTMSEKMKAIPNFRSALTFYNDKVMDKMQTQYKTEIKTQEKKLTEMENRYYKQFTAMEKAMANMQSQTSALNGMLGNNG